MVKTIDRRRFVGGSAALAAAFATAGLPRFGALAQDDAWPSVDGLPPLKIGWSTIYTTPSWMTETQNEIEEEIDRLTEMGAEIDFTVFDANGDTATQIAQIQTMIDQQYDICLLIAGSATALDQVVESAHNAGVIVVNWDSLVSTDQLTAIVFEDQVEWGTMTGQWMVDTLGGSGKILAINGPAGIAVSEQRWQGAKEVFDANPDIEIIGTANIEYNEAPALPEMESLLSAHPDVQGIWCQAGAHASAALKTLQSLGMDLVPITGENFNAFLKGWCDLISDGSDFQGFATAEANYMAVVSLDLAIMAKQGLEVPSTVEIPLPMIDNDNACEWANADLPDDWYSIPVIPGPDERRQMIEDAMAAEAE